MDEFAGKVDQIADGGFNVKGVFISGSSFQQGALEVAKNLGFMVIELNELNQLDIKFHKKEKGKNKSQRFLEADEKVYQFFKKIFDPSQNQSIPVLSKKNIAKRANEVLNDFNPQILERGHKLSIDKLIDYFTLKHNITFKTIPNITANESDLLGYFDLNDKEININEKLEWEGNRKAFVIAHEIGHFILHKDIQVTQDYYDSFSDSEFDFRTNKYTLNNFKNWIEWQANYFAACLLMPELPLRYHLIKFQTRAGISKQGRIYLDRQPVNWRDYYAIINYLSDHFNTTNTSLIYRLEEFNIITYDPSILHWQTINELSTNEYIEKHSVYAKEKEDNYDK